jgi:hypothetical protein
MAAQNTSLVSRSESRLFPVLLSAGLAFLIEAMPMRFQVLPQPVGRGLEGLLILSMIIAGLSSPTSIWAKVERWVVFVIAAVVTLLEFAILKTLLGAIVYHTHVVSAITLLASAISVWIMNVLVFSLVYWQLDRGGPNGRALGWSGRADFSFAQGNPGDGVPADWTPHFADYFALGFSTSTAFSPTDTLPLTPRAKMLMVAQSTLSLITIVVVAARAINTLA